MTQDEAVRAIIAEFERAKGIYPNAFHSRHEGWAVLREEVDELWDAVKANNHEQATREAVQVAAMALQFLVELGLASDLE